MDEYYKANKLLWDQLAEVHYKTDFYDVKGFLNGKSSIDPIEEREVGDVTDKSLLHLMCHFGMDTLSWARLGANVTGVDFSEKAINLARTLSHESGIQARFIQSNVYDLSAVLDDEFDIVFTSGGVIVWLQDLKKWSRIIARHLKEGGFFYIREFHPFGYIFDNDNETELRVRYPYFQRETPLRFEDDTTYADSDARIEKIPSFEWNHSISKIITVLLDAGLKIDSFNEYPFTAYKALPFMVQNKDGRWVLAEHAESVPLMFSLKATKQ
ncbi:MAG: class I SAM-dependent methyltransferase [Candidatus Thorarchaeota archaeon]|jgi:ubiquinone/menaquinone biosynthesis C-methylase UbiE